MTTPENKPPASDERPAWDFAYTPWLCPKCSGLVLSGETCALCLVPRPKEKERPAEADSVPASDEMPEFKHGDYVLATKYSDGGPKDHWFVGLYDQPFFERHHVTDNEGNRPRANGFRRVEHIVREEGDWLVANAEDIGRGDISLWTHLERMRRPAEAAAGGIPPYIQAQLDKCRPTEELALELEKAVKVLDNDPEFLRDMITALQEEIDLRDAEIAKLKADAGEQPESEAAAKGGDDLWQKRWMGVCRLLDAEKQKTKALETRIAEMKEDRAGWGKCPCEDIHDRDKILTQLVQDHDEARAKLAESEQAVAHYKAKAIDAEAERGEAERDRVRLLGQRLLGHMHRIAVRADNACKE